MNKRKIDKNDFDQSLVTKQAKTLHDEPEKNAVKFDFMVSLQNIVMAKIINNLWMNQNTQEEIVKLFDSHFKPVLGMWEDDWDKIENNIVTKISQFSLPHLISSKLTYIVPAVGKAIRQWITHFDKVLILASNYSEYRSKYSVDLISNITWTARGKIDYAQTARNILVNPDICLSEDVKLNIACIYCLEDKIVLFAPNVVNEYFLADIGSFMRLMIYFWSSHITGNNSKLYSPLYFHYNSQNRNMSFNEHILCILIENEDWTNVNEVAIIYVWNKLSAEEKDKHITLLMKQLNNQGLKYTLLSNINYEQQKGIFKEYSNSILVGILKDWLWEEYFLPTTLHFLDAMKPSDFLYVLKKVTKRILTNYQKGNKFMCNQYKFIFKELWKKCSRNVKDFAFEHENGCFLRDLLISLSYKQNMDIIGLIINDLNTKQKKNMISGFHGIECCSLLIKNDLWEILELFIIPSLFSENDIIQFKEKFVKHEGRSVAVHFLKQNALDKIEHFMIWGFKSQEEIDQFRKSLSHDVIWDATLASIITHNKADFTELEIHFNWCAKGDLKVINEFKAKAPKSFDDRFISELIENNYHDLLDKVLNWCFLGNQQKIIHFKSNMYKDDDLACCINSVTINLIEVDNSFRMLEKFLDWCFTNEQEVKEFKTWLLNPVGSLHSVCAELTFLFNLELADKFINWCITSPEDVCIYKNTLMLSNRDMKYILSSGYMYEQNDFPLLIKWFNPSKDTLQKFYTVFFKKECSFYAKIV